MRLFHNIFYRKFKSLPLSYYKRGRELIVAETFTSSVSASFNLSQVGILPDYFEDKSNFQFGLSNVTLILFTPINESVIFDVSKLTRSSFKLFKFKLLLV